jgi:cation/acetate symporter
MALTSTKRLINPRLGVFFAIFSSAFCALIVLALMCEQLGAPTDVLRWSILAAPLLAYAIIGIASATRDPLEFFAAGRRVPAVYNGLTLAFSALGGTGIVALTGALFLVGFDALCLVIGGLAGFVVMGILLAPFFRKFGAYTIPSYLGRRFESPALRVVCAVLIIPPLALMLAAELKMAAFTVTLLTGAAPAVGTGLLGGAVLLVLWPGGTRGLTWAAVAASITALLAILVPVAIVAVMWTNLPLPQLSHGPIMRAMGRQETLQGLPILIAQGFTFDLPGTDFTAISKRFASAFSSVGPAGFVAATLTTMMGVAAAPWLLPRIATAPGVYHARKSIGWATLDFGIVMLTAASIAVFARGLFLEQMAAGVVPDWVRQLAALGLAQIDSKTAVQGGEGLRVMIGNVGFMRDAILFALPMAGGLSGVFVALAATGALAACFAGACASAGALSAVLAEDIAYGLRVEPPTDVPRLQTGRNGVLGALAAGCAIALLLPGDPLDFMLWALALTGSALFPVLVLSIWWKRINAFGAVAGLASGFAVALLAIVAGDQDIFPIEPALAGVFGIPASIIATIATSLATPNPGRHVLELVRDIRVPGGEILYDREMRLLRVKKRQRA